MRMRGTKCNVGIGVVLGLAAATAAQAGTVPPLDFVTIGDAGNRNTIPSETPMHSNQPKGGVDHEFRITRSPVTVSQWFEFVDAYAPFTDVRSQEFLSSVGFFRPDGTLFHIAGREQTAVEVSWRFAARYMNWLHNDKAITAEAFESGVYDTSTFVRNAQGHYLDQREPSPGAKYWLPSIDEWTKAVYYDPNRNGKGQEGYWQYPNSSDIAPTFGETDALDLGVLDPPLDIGSYPDVLTPYGLLDVSGGVTEVTGTGFDPFGLRQFVSSSQGIGVASDSLDWGQSVGLPVLSLRGFRVATTVPAPTSAMVVLVGAIHFAHRKRRM